MFAIDGTIGSFVFHVAVGEVVGHWLNLLIDRSSRPFVWAVNAIADWGIRLKIRLWLVLFLILPAGSALVLLDTHSEQLGLISAVVLASALIGFVPLSNVVKYLLIGRDLEEIDRFCRRLKQGHYGAAFDLPDERDDEPQIIALKRNLNWMARVISRRVSELHSALEGAYEDTNHYKSLSRIDPLTGLGNRRDFEECLGLLVRQTEISGQPLALMFIDCDKFKKVNDTQGHQAGDDLLRCLADIIRRNIRRNSDLAFRYGGDEFVVVCVGQTIREAARPAERIRRDFVEYCSGLASLSVGVAGHAARDVGDLKADLDGFIEAADRAAYRAKAKGGDKVEIAL